MSKVFTIKVHFMYFWCYFKKPSFQFRNSQPGTGPGFNQFTNTLHKIRPLLLILASAYCVKDVLCWLRKHLCMLFVNLCMFVQNFLFVKHLDRLVGILGVFKIKLQRSLIVHFWLAKLQFTLILQKLSFLPFPPPIQFFWDFNQPKQNPEIGQLTSITNNEKNNPFVRRK